jgi:hypothetical protein
MNVGMSCALRGSVVVWIALIAGCGSDPGPGAEQPEGGTTSEPASSAAAPTGAVACDDEQTCREQGALAKMVGDTDKAKAFFTRGCELTPASKSCDELKSSGP